MDFGTKPKFSRTTHEIPGTVPQFSRTLTDDCVEFCAQWCRAVVVDWWLVHRDRVATVNCSTRPCPRGGYSRPLVQVTWPHSFSSLAATSPRRSLLPVTRSTVKKAVLQRWPRLQYNNRTSVPAGTVERKWPGSSAKRTKTPRIKKKIKKKTLGP